MIRLRSKMIVIAVFLAGFIFLSFVRPEKEELLNIRFASGGCFHYWEGRLTVFKKDGAKTARFSLTGYAEEEKTITDAEYSEVQKFLQELLLLKESYNCTTTDTYMASFQGNIIKKTDGGCSWNGFENITESIFHWQEKNRK